MSAEGLLVAIEGGEGSGKDTLVARLKNVLDPSETVFTREPGGTPIGEKLRAVLLAPDTDMGAEEELLIFVAARIALMRMVIRPALARGMTVISNRFELSTTAYQIYGRKQPELLDFLQVLSKRAVGEICPHYILLDISPALGSKRVAQRNDGVTRFDAEKRAFHERVRAGYLAHYTDSGYGHKIDASTTEESVFREALATIRDWKNGR